MRKPGSASKRGPAPAVVVIAIITACVALVLVLTAVRESLTPVPAAPGERSGPPGIEAGVKAIAARFACSCGSCGGEPLDHCTCETAIGIRQEIRDGLAAGLPPARIVELVNNTHGGLLPDSAD